MNRRIHILAGLTAIGFATFMLGLVIILPLLGHATWHAYRDIVRFETPQQPA